MSEDSVGRAPVSGVLCRCEAEPARCGAAKSALASKAVSNIVFANGRLLVGVPAFAALWRELPGHRWLARVAMQPVLLPLWTLLYDALAWALYHWNKRRARRRARVVAPAARAGPPDLQ